MVRHVLLALCVAVIFAGCGYQFQGKTNPLREVGVEKIFVVEFTNTTYRPGIEQVFTTSLIREIQKSRSFQLVDSEKEADAILTGEVRSADSSINSQKKLAIANIPDREFIVGSEFTASVSCHVRLTDRLGRVIFTRTETGSKVYPGAARVGDAGATGPLINDSEQRLAIQFVASQMMASVYQRMIDVF